MTDNEMREARASYVNSLGYYLDSDAILVEIAWQLKRIGDASSEKKPTPVVILNSSGQTSETEMAQKVMKALINLEKGDFVHI
jgi:hypothetical protein